MPVPPSPPSVAAFQASPRRALAIAALITILAFSEIGCGGDSSGVASSSQQQVPAGDVATTNAHGAVSVQGLPATMSTIRLVS